MRIKKLASSLVIVSLLTPSFAPFSSFGFTVRPNPCPYQVEQLKITASSAEIPTPLIKPKKIIPLVCDRPFSFQNEIYSADSPQAQDASTLRYFVRDVPEADSILQNYQNNRIKSKISAYTGTVGLLLLIFSGPISQSFNVSNQNQLRSILVWSGLALSAGGFFYSFTLLKSNESLIPEAVNAYNKAHPDNGIELKFTTGWSF